MLFDLMKLEKLLFLLKGLPFCGYSQIWGRVGAKSTPSLKSITHPTMMKLGTVIAYLKTTQKIYESRDTPLSSADISIFLSEISKFCHIRKHICKLYFGT